MAGEPSLVDDLRAERRAAAAREAEQVRADIARHRGQGQQGRTDPATQRGRSNG